MAGYLHAGETYLEAAQRRLAEELGLRSPLHKLGAFRMADNGATKFVELCATEAGTVPFVLPGHIESVRFFTIDEIDNDLRADPERFTETFPYVYRLFRLVTST